jgi:hypothetical protein
MAMAEEKKSYPCIEVYVRSDAAHRNSPGLLIEVPHLEVGEL